MKLKSARQRNIESLVGFFIMDAEEIYQQGCDSSYHVKQEKSSKLEGTISSAIGVCLHCIITFHDVSCSILKRAMFVYLVAR